MRSFLSASASAILCVIIVSCSSGHSPVAPDNSPPPLTNDSAQGVSQSSGSRVTWGMWDVFINPEDLTADLVPVRGANFKCNVVNFLQPPKAPDNLIHIKIDPNGTDFVAGNVNCLITLEHPFPGSVFCGFDVQGIVIGEHANYAWESDPTIIGSLPPNILLQNPDGWTRWWNQPEFTTYGKLFGYIEGNLAHHGWTSTHTLNAYKVFADDLESDAPFNPYQEYRCFFSSSEPGSNTRRYQLQFPTAGGVMFHFKYAVSACWAEPLPGSTSPYSPDDFPITANQPEPFQVDFINTGSSAYYEDESDYGGNIVGSIKIRDWQFTGSLSTVKDEIAGVKIESPTLFDGVISLDLDTATLDPDDSLTILVPFTIEDVSPSDAHNQLLLVTVLSANPTTYEPQIPGITGFDYPDAPLAAYGVSQVSILSSKSGWARTWGGSSWQGEQDVAVDSSGNVFVTGGFRETVDFDPGPGEDWHAANGGYDAYLSKFDSCGSFQWARTWGGIEEGTGTWASGVAVDGSGNVYVTGWFDETADFDPGPGVDEHTSNGHQADFLSKFDSFGEFQWARTWGCTQVTWASAVSVDGSGSVYVTGAFEATADFDPGPGIDEHVPNGYEDIFLSKFDSFGEFQWARTWGGINYDRGCGVAVDGSGKVYVTGSFLGTVDFDPGAGIDEHTSTDGGSNIFVSGFDSSGEFQWARTWGEPGAGEGWGVAVDGSGNVCVTGLFIATVDFDPGSGTDYHSAIGVSFPDVFLSKFDSFGSFQWARTWGGTEDDMGWGVAVDGTGNVCVTGWFTDIVDFDPGTGIDEHASNGLLDVFLSRFDSSGEFQWARTWGGKYGDLGLNVAIDGSGSVYVTGTFAGTVDFDPGDDTDYHTSPDFGGIFLSKFLPNGSW